MPSSSTTSGVVIALLLSGGVGRARSRATGSPVSHPCSRQYAHADDIAVNRRLNVLGALSPHTNTNHPDTRFGSNSPT